MGTLVRDAITYMTRPVPDTVVNKQGWHDLKELDEHGEGLTQWEADFVESLHGWLRAGKTLTERQRATLDKIREEKIP